MDEDQVLQVEAKGGSEVVTLNRPGRLNALNQPLADALLGPLGSKRRESACRVILIRGAGREFLLRRRP